MATSFVAFLCCLAVFTALLAGARGAPLADRETKDTVSIVNEIVASATEETGGELLEFLLASVRSERAASTEEETLVEISEASASSLRGKMERMNEKMVADIKSNSQGCEKIGILRVDAKDAGDIPSYYYEITCPDKCTADGIGNRGFRPVALETIYFQKMADAKNQYNVGFRRQVIGCCLEDNAQKPILSDKPKPPVISNRR